MKHDLQLDRSRLLGFKLASKDAVPCSVEPSDPRLGAKIGKIPGVTGSSPLDPRLGAKIGKITDVSASPPFDPRIGAKIGKITNKIDGRTR